MVVRPRRVHAGFTYIAVLLLVTILSVASLAAVQSWSKANEHQQLIQLRWIGGQYRQAIGTYYEASPGTVKRFPTSLDELAFDKRYLTVRRHIRQIYEDPLTSKQDWELLRAPDGGIWGVRSTDRRGYRFAFVYQPNRSLLPGQQASPLEPSR